MSPTLLRNLTKAGFTQPTAIQAQAIPVALAGRDVLGCAQTGTGKTAAFVVPMLERLSGMPKGQPRALILAPTRELAIQIQATIDTLGRDLQVFATTVVGGADMQAQVRGLRQRPDIIVATPGRLLDHMWNGTISLLAMSILVLDEADRMLDMGFIRDIRKILALLPKQRQNLLFSATFSDEIRALADSLLNQPALIEAARRNAIADKVAHVVHPVDRERKRNLLAHLIKQHGWSQVLVFTRTKHGANKLAEFLTTGGIPALAIHGNKSQTARTHALAKFKTGSLQVLVATDIAARGIDINELPHVVNFELPQVPEDYVHRIGRTGRAGAEGDAVSLVCVDEIKLLAAIEKLIKHELRSQVIAGFEPDPRIKAEPIKNGRSGEPRGATPSRHPPKNPANRKPGAKKPAGAGFSPSPRQRFDESRRVAGGRGR
ncbi:MAG TPA: RNA helicase [Nitrospira sp.]|nr:RNA helicase [Nitrospira sp.]